LLYTRQLALHSAKAQQFAEELRSHFGLTVHLWDERLTAAAFVNHAV
jgi:RNase H-fold protein (predicted Holliday junction resolvase)